MLFLVVSQPGPTPPSEMNARRKDYWAWMDKNKADGLVKHSWSRAGRGAVAVLDVDGNQTLHRLLNEWCELVPAKFDVYPLIDPAEAQAYLAAT